MTLVGGIRAEADDLPAVVDAAGGGDRSTQRPQVVKGQILGGRLRHPWDRQGNQNQKG